MVIQASRCIHKVIGVMEWLIGLKCAPDIILHFWRQLLSSMDYKVDNDYGRSRHGVNFTKERYQNNGRPFEYEMDTYPNLYAGALIDELCTNARWNISVQCAYRYFSYVLHIVGSILDQGLSHVTEKIILHYFIRDLITYHKRHCHDLGHHDSFNNLEHMNEIFMSNQNIKLAYEGYYDFPNLCNCRYIRLITAGEYVEKKMPTCINKLPLYLNSNKKWTCAVYNFMCSHKFIDLINYVRNSGLTYWDQVMVINSLVDDIFSLYPNNNTYSFMKTLPPLPQQDELYPSHIKSCIEDYNYWKECIWQFKMVAKDSPAKYSYGKLEKLIYEFCVDVTVHHQKLFMKYY